MAGQFLVFSSMILIAGMVSISLWIQHEIKDAVIQRTGEVTALYVNSFVSPQLGALDQGSRLSSAAVEALDGLLSETALGSDIVAFKLWAADGTVIYSPNRALIGRRFGIHRELERALAGGIVSELSDLSLPDNVYERELWDLLIETYAPVRVEGSPGVVAVAEFYQDPEPLLTGIRRAQLLSWAFVGAATLVMYLLLVGIVRRVSTIIESQRNALEGNVSRLSRLLDQNSELRGRMQSAAGRTTALNERYLHRISADIHDGPAQNVSFALLRLEDLDKRVANQSDDAEDLDTVRSSLASALADLRAIARGLRLPEIENLSPSDTARRVLKDFERATGRQVLFHHREVPTEAPLPLKITMYRVLQEALANSYRHANGARHEVTLTYTGNDVRLEVVDDGSGFDPHLDSKEGALGLVGMRERVELLGGRFEVTSHAPSGTRVLVDLPLTQDGGGGE